jgi:ketosteroid isomerase-like protein
MTIGCEGRRLYGPGLRAVVCGSFSGLMLIAGCNQAPAPVDTKAVENAVRAADMAWSKAAVAMDAAGVASYYADDATVLPPNGPVLASRDAEQKAWAEMLVPGNSLSWTPVTVKSAASGELVYVQGTYTGSFKGPEGKAVADTLAKALQADDQDDEAGKYLEVWKKQVDGGWKAVEDMWSSDLPVVAAAPVAAKKKG